LIASFVRLASPSPLSRALVNTSLMESSFQMAKDARR
jgi:hypothetical protein